MAALGNLMASLHFFKESGSVLQKGFLQHFHRCLPLPNAELKLFLEIFAALDGPAPGQHHMADRSLCLAVVPILLARESQRFCPWKTVASDLY